MVTLDRQRPIVMERVKEFAERLTARLAKLRTEEAVVAATEAPQQNKGRSENRGATSLIGSHGAIAASNAKGPADQAGPF